MNKQNENTVENDKNDNIVLFSNGTLRTTGSITISGGNIEITGDPIIVRSTTIPRV